MVKVRTANEEADGIERIEADLAGFGASATQHDKKTFCVVSIRCHTVRQYGATLNA
jgi:hypothetical protein